jgi:hypothetical protein
MPAGVIQRDTAFAAAGTNSNVLAGSQFTLITEPSVISQGMTQSIAGNIAIGINVGNRMIVEQGALPPLSALQPVIPDTFYFTYPALPGEQLQILAVAAAAGTLRHITQIATA